MNGLLILAEAATGHPDSTLSILRAGINRAQAAAGPVSLDLCLIARIEAQAAERGAHDFEINCIDADGRDRLPTIRGQFESPHGAGSNNILMKIKTAVQEFGVYEFNLIVDRIQLASWTLRVERIGEAGNANA